MSFKKFFTLEEANSLVPRLLKDIPHLQKLTAELNENFPDVKNAWKKARFNGGSAQGAGYLRVAVQYTRLSSDLESRGCVLKGVENGLVDFPSIRDGREVFLCWKMPEKEIRYWHDIDAGFAGRQSI
ncbi:MAG: DUF2203 domain-containing protein [Nitrospinae bacterium]|nr:DUF2203 domain-containing protein [Nitrospinota bacterium]